MLFLLSRPCLATDTNCNHPPVWVKIKTHTAIATIPYTYDFIVTDQDKELINIEHDPLPDMMTVRFTHAASTIIDSTQATAKITVTLDSEIDSPAGTMVCFSAVDVRGTQSLGLFCPSFQIVKPDYLFITGTLRIFNGATAANKIDGVSTPWPSAAVIKPNLRADNRKIELQTPSDTMTASSFNTWWADSADVRTKLHTITMVSHPTLQGSTDKYDPKKSQRVFVMKRPWWPVVETNSYFTYELHTKMDLLDTETGLNALHFAVTGGEMWVFLNNVLVLDMTQNTIAPAAALDTQTIFARSATLTFDQLRSKIGQYGGDGSKADTYNIDIFYTHRTLDLAKTGFYMEFANSTACSAITVLKDPSYAELLKSAISFDYASNASPSAVRPAWPIQWSTPSQFDTDFYHSSYALISPGASNAENRLQLISSTDTSTSSVVFARQRLKVLSGFEATFNFRMTAAANGFAFCIQDHSVTARGSDGAGLGYSGITKAVCVEFDSNPDIGSMDAGFNYQHISVHKPNPQGVISAAETPENWPSGSVPVGNIKSLPFMFNNNTLHNVRIELSPSETAYWLYLYLGVNGAYNVRPLYTASFGKDELESLWPDGAYVGFSSANTASKSGDVFIESFKMIVIPPLAIMSAPIPPSTGTNPIWEGQAGKTLDVVVQLRDACGAPLSVRGESKQFSAKYFHKYSSKLRPVDALFDENAVYDEIIPTIVDLDGFPGRYRISGTPRRSGDYKLYFYYKEVDGSTQPLGLAKLASQNLIYKDDKFYSGSVTSAIESSDRSYYLYSQIPPALDNTRNSEYFDNSSTNGVVCIRVSKDAQVVATQTIPTRIIEKGKIFTTKALYQNWHSGLGSIYYGLCVNRDSTTKPEILSILQYAYATRTITPTPPTLPVQTTVSATWLVDSGRTTYFEYSSEAAQISKFEFVTGEIPNQKFTRFYLESTVPERDPAGLGKGMIVLHPTQLSAKTQEFGLFYVHLRDIYGNNVVSGFNNEVTYIFSPVISHVSASYQTVKGEPFFVSEYTTDNSGEFRLSVSVGANNPIGLDGLLIVDAGPAHFSTSAQTGINTGSTVDKQIYFNFFPFWDIIARQYNIKYTPTFAGVYTIKVYINPPEDAKTDPAKLAMYEMTSSKNQVVAILAGPVHHHSTVLESLDGNDNTQIVTVDGTQYTIPALAPLYRAGTPLTYSLQSRDKYGNPRFSSADGNNVFRLYLIKLDNASLPNPTPPMDPNTGLPIYDTDTFLDTSEFLERVQISSSFQYSSGNNYIQFAHDGSGVYTARLMLNKVDGYAIRIDLVSHVGDSFGAPVTNFIQPPFAGSTMNFRRDCQPIGDVGTCFNNFAKLQHQARWKMEVTPGLISNESILQFYCGESTSIGSTLCTTGSPSNTAYGFASNTLGNIKFSFIPKDTFGNEIFTLTPVAIQQDLVFLYESSTFSYQFGSSYSLTKDGGSSSSSFTGLITASGSGVYSLTPTLNSVSRPPKSVGSLQFQILPSVTKITNLRVQWPSAITTTTITSFIFTDMDFHLNSRLVDPVNPNSLSESIITPSAFKVFYRPYNNDGTQLEDICIDPTTLGSVPACDVANIVDVAEGRPYYSCSIKAQTIHESRTVEVQIVNVDQSGCNPDDWTTSCPPPECMTKSSAFVDQSIDSTSYIRAYRVFEGKTASLQIAADYKTLDNEFVITNGQITSLPGDGLSVGTFTAGYTIELYVFEGSTYDEPIRIGSATQRRLTLASQGNKSVVTAQTVTVSACTAEFAPICSGTLVNARVYKFTLYFEKTLISEQTSFSLRYIDPSTIHSSASSYYSFFIKPSSFSSNLSIAARSIPDVVAGSPWQFSFFPFDKFSNPIPTADVFIGISSEVVNTKTVYFVNSRLVQVLTSQTETTVPPQDVKCIYTAYNAQTSTAPRLTGTFLCDVPAVYTKFGPKIIYFLSSTDPLPLSPPATARIGGITATSSVSILSAALSLPNSQFSLMPLANQFTPSLAPIANQEFFAYLFPFDRFNNPTRFEANVDEVVISLTVAASEQSTAPTVTVVSPWTFKFSTTSSFVFAGSFKINKVSRGGFIATVTSAKFGQLTGYGTNQATPFIISVLSQLPSPTPLFNIQNNDPDDVSTSQNTQLTAIYRTALYKNIATATPIVLTDTAFTIDAVFKFFIRIYDINLQPLVQTNQSVNEFETTSTVTISLTTGSRVIPTNFAPVQHSQYNVPVYGLYSFTVDPQYYTSAGIYDLSVTLNTRSASIIIALYSFTVSPGKPWMDSTIASIPAFNTGKKNTITFKLYDRALNLIKAPYIPDFTNLHPSNVFPQLGKVQPTLLSGRAACNDVHAQTDWSQLSYRLPIVGPSSTHSAILMSSQFNTQTSEYTFDLTPSPRGTYSFNLTLISTTNVNQPDVNILASRPDVNGSVFSCDRLLAMSLNVASGYSIASKSSYKISSVQGVAGQTATVTVILRDRDGTQVDPGKEGDVRIFYNPDAPNELNPLNALYWNGLEDSRSNLLNVVSTNLSQILGRGQWVFDITPRFVGNWNFAVYVSEFLGDTETKVWRRITESTSPLIWTVIHGLPHEVKFLSTPTIAIAGQSLLFQLAAIDAWDNAISTDQLHSFFVTIQRDSSTMLTPLVDIEGLRWTIPTSEILTNSLGVSTISFTPSWEGKFSISVQMRSKDGKTHFADSDLEPGSIVILHASCAGQFLAKNPNALPETVPTYRCAHSSTNECVLSYSQCTDRRDSTPAAPIGFFLNPSNPTIAISLTSSEGGGYTKCADGTYIQQTELVKCKAVPPCPPGMIQCPSNKSQCRSVATDCPSSVVASPGWIVCPNGLTTSQSIAECPTIPASVYASCSGYICPGGSCKQSSSDCPTLKTCPQAGWVHCLSDGQCKPTSLQCLSPPNVQNVTPAQCATRLNSPNAVMCWNKSCAATIQDCPAQITCNVGFVLCAADNTCKRTLSQCYIPDDQKPVADPVSGTVSAPPLPIIATGISITCAATEFRCGDASCASNLVLCPTQPSCSPSTPVLCSDFTCKASLSLCNTPTSCSASKLITCPATGACVRDGSFCERRKTCSIEAPILCPATQSCMKDVASCETAKSCPQSTPFACSNGGCRRNLAECSTPISCPVNLPYKCPDGSCALSIQMCTRASTLNSDHGSGSSPETETFTNSLYGCPSILTLCSTNECSISQLTCPSHVTCPIGSVRCLDGSCRASCKGVQSNASCQDRGLVTCPSASGGIVCARKIAECAQGPTCPMSAPIRCIDSTCASSLTFCPPLPQLPPSIDKTPCPDGGWALDNACGTPITCHPLSPIKCLDLSCRSSVQECPILQQCDGITPYRCSSGTCAVSPYDCPPIETTLCRSNAPLKCSIFKGNAACVDRLDNCPSVQQTLLQELALNDPKLAPDPFVTTCTAGFVQCRDFSCKLSQLDCPPYSCPLAFPVICEDGSCVKTRFQCPLANGCSPSAPFRCPGVGKCVVRLFECPTEQCTASGLVACPDGSCEQGLCQNAANGCPVSQFKCSDGTCVKDPVSCTSQENTNSINSCPPGKPYRCAIGLCTEKSSQCPSLTASGICGRDAPVLCASGECAQSTELCSLIKPCRRDQTRCRGDGSCRTSGACPNHNTCPAGWARCLQSDFASVLILDGICRPIGQCLAANGCQIGSTGTALHRCNSNGRCVEDQALCTSILGPSASGCSSHKPFKCWNGSCAVSEATCDATNNCPHESPVRCQNGGCTADVSLCPVDDISGDFKICEKTLCADGSCEASPSLCKTPFGCPAHSPVRCQNGLCRRYPATYRNPRFGLSLEQIEHLTCSPTISCVDGMVQCDDFSCVLNPREECPSTAYPCKFNEFKCQITNQCVPSEDKCGKQLVIDPDSGIETWQPKPVNSILQCPSSLPSLCPNGLCTADINNCVASYVPGKSTLVGSPTSAQVDANKEYQVLCADGFLRDSYSECITFAKQVNEEFRQSMLDAGTPELAPECADYCPTGVCLLSGQNPAKVCESISSCSVGHFRCFDSSCRLSCPVNDKPIECPEAGTKLCIDGICRPAFQCPLYNGCSFWPTERYHCATRDCAASADDCFAASRRQVHQYAVRLLDESPWSTKDPSFQLFPDKLNPSNFYVNNTMVNNSTGTDGSGHLALTTQQSTTPPKDSPLVPDRNGHPNTPDAPDYAVLSCSENCVASEKLPPSAIQYDPLRSEQKFLIGSSSSEFYLQLYSGLRVDTNKDMSLYIEPVSDIAYYNASNKVTFTRMAEFGTTLTASQTILSPPFSCSFGDGIVEPLDAAIKISTTFDRSLYPVPLSDDICLARLRRFPGFNYMVWECIFTEDERKTNPQYTIRSDSSLPSRQASSFVSQCYDDDTSYYQILNSQTGEIETMTVTESKKLQARITKQDNTTNNRVQKAVVVPTGTLVKQPAVYAFIHSPISTSTPYYTNNSTNWFKNNIIWLLFVILGGIFVVFASIWVCTRLSRYRKKTDKIQQDIEKMQSHIDDAETNQANSTRQSADIDQYQDDRNRVSFSRNPMAQAVIAEEQLLTANNEDIIQKKKDQHETKRRESVHRQSLIHQMENENEVAMSQLQILHHRSVSVARAQGESTTVSNVDQIEQLELEMDYLKHHRNPAPQAPPAPQPSVSIGPAIAGPAITVAGASHRRSPSTQYYESDQTAPTTATSPTVHSRPNPPASGSRTATDVNVLPQTNVSSDE